MGALSRGLRLWLLHVVDAPSDHAQEVGAIDRHQIDQVRVVEQFRLAHVETFALELGQYNARGELKTDFRCITMDSAMPRAASPPVHSATISMVSVERLPGAINPNQD
jgi:hypothetical protein